MKFTNWKAMRLPPQEDSLAELYHENSKYRVNLPIHARQFLSQDEKSALARHLSYPGKKRIMLKRDPGLWSASLYSALLESSEKEAPVENKAPIDLPLLSTLLIGTYGKKEQSDRRTVSSEQDLYPVEIFLYARAIDGLAQGLYYFNPEAEELHLVKETIDFEGQVLPIFTAEGAPAAPPAAILFVTAYFTRAQLHFGDRAYRYCLLEAGKTIQNIGLITGSLGIHSVPLGSYYDYEADNLLGLDGVQHSCLYLVQLG